MKLLVGAASILALTLFLSPVTAQETQPPVDQPAIDQPAPIVEVPAPAIPEKILALLSDSRAASELSIQELQARAKMARRFAADESLTEDVRNQLKAIAEASRAEIETRKQAQQQPAPQPEQQPVAQPEPQAVPQPEQQAAPVEAPKAVEPAPVPEEVMTLINDGRALADIDSEELKSRAKSARRFSKDEQLPQDLRDKLTNIAQDARIELAKRDQAKQEQPKQEQPKQEQPVVEQPVVEPPKQDQQAAPAPIVEAPKDVQLVNPDTPPVAPPVAAPAKPAAADVKLLDSNPTDPASEQQARAYLNDNIDLATLSDEDLRARLDGIRTLVSANRLSRETKRAVREKLKSEREILRGRVQQAEAKKAMQEAAQKPAAVVVPPAEVAAVTAAPLPPVPVQPPPPPPPANGNTTVNNNTTINNTTIITNVTPVQVVLQDRRPPERLQLSELQRRVQVYNEAQYDEDYDDANRAYWAAAVARDREILRRRMIAERRARAEQLALEASNDSIDIEINLDFSPSRPPPPRAVFAAEVDDAELEDVLVAPPRRSINQRYSVDEIAAQPRLRDSVSRIEIDTIRFGYNEAFVREEQLQSLDAIAAIIERIVKKYPNEVFMIEGHTDAPGSNAYNAKLSKLRAEAIKKALTTYYVIPGRNLRTVGLGERFLKIPTADAEAENRRVSISRITNLLSAN